mgnify:CR=1 FL=1
MEFFLFLVEKILTFVKMNLRKIFYVSGIISAILVPLLFWHFGNQKLKEPLANVIDIGLPPKFDKNSRIDASFKPFRKWDFKKIVVPPNSARENSTFYLSELKKLEARNQKETGIEFIINDQNSYDDFISILNDFDKFDQQHYSIDLDKTGHLFAMVDYKDPNKIAVDDNLLDNDTLFSGFYEPTFFEDQTYYLAQLPKNAFYLIFGYLFLLQISVLSLVRKSI